MDEKDRNRIKNMNTSILAYIGDAVYELGIRKKLVERKAVNVNRIHKKAITYVSADGQAVAAKKLMQLHGFLTEDEMKIIKRARNHRTTSHPRGADPKAYKWATGFEALFGYLYLLHEYDRLEEILTKAVIIIEEGEK